MARIDDLVFRASAKEHERAGGWAFLELHGFDHGFKRCDTSSRGDKADRAVGLGFVQEVAIRSRCFENIARLELIEKRGSGAARVFDRKLIGPFAFARRGK